MAKDVISMAYWLGPNCLIVHQTHVFSFARKPFRLLKALVRTRLSSVVMSMTCLSYIIVLTSILFIISLLLIFRSDGLLTTRVRYQIFSTWKYFVSMGGSSFARLPILRSFLLNGCLMASRVISTLIQLLMLRIYRNWFSKPYPASNQWTLNYYVAIKVLSDHCFMPPRILGQT